MTSIIKFGMAKNKSTTKRSGRLGVGEQIANMLRSSGHGATARLPGRRDYEPGGPEGNPGAFGPPERGRRSARLSNCVRKMPDGKRPGPECAVDPRISSGVEAVVEVAWLAPFAPSSTFGNVESGTGYPVGLTHLARHGNWNNPRPSGA
jgi:hypothetical protein